MQAMADEHMIAAQRQIIAAQKEVKQKEAAAAAADMARQNTARWTARAVPYRTVPHRTVTALRRPVAAPRAARSTHCGGGAARAAARRPRSRTTSGRL